MWVEINGHVNYPLKACLIEMQERNEINMDCDHEKFCVSWFTIQVSNVGTSLAVQAWNAHPIPGILIFVTLNTQKCRITYMNYKVLAEEFPTL